MAKTFIAKPSRRRAYRQKVFKKILIGYPWRCPGMPQVDFCTFRHQFAMRCEGMLCTLRGFDPSAWHHVKLAFSGNHLEGSIDHQKLADVQDAKASHGLTELGSSYDPKSFRPRCGRGRAIILPATDAQRIVSKGDRFVLGRSTSNLDEQPPQVQGSCVEQYAMGSFIAHRLSALRGMHFRRPPTVWETVAPFDCHSFNRTI